MKEVSKFFGLQAGETQVCNGFRFDCVRKEVLTKGAAPTVFGTFTAPDGSVTDYTHTGVFANKLNKLAGVVNKVTFPAKVNNSQQEGENKVLSATLSANKKQKRFLKAWRFMLQVHRLYCPEATDIPSAMWYVLKNEDDWFTHIEEVKKQQAIEKAKAEEEAKKQAEEEAKKLEEEQKIRIVMIENYAKKKNIPFDIAEANLLAIGVI